MITRLKNEKGMTLLEILATSIIVAVSMIGLYTGIIYADKQIQRNYHDRVATLHASGELEWQIFYRKNYKQYDLFTGRSVVIDKLAREKELVGQMSVRLTEAVESPFGTYVPYEILEVTVVWTEPGDRTQRKIVIREDFY